MKNIILPKRRWFDPQKSSNAMAFCIQVEEIRLYNVKNFHQISFSGIAKNIVQNSNLSFFLHYTNTVFTLQINLQNNLQFYKGKKCE